MKPHKPAPYKLPSAWDATSHAIAFQFPDEATPVLAYLMRWTTPTPHGPIYYNVAWFLSDSHFHDTVTFKNCEEAELVWLARYYSVDWTKTATGTAGHIDFPRPRYR